MVAPKNEGLEEEDGKTELDLGIEESIRRCEALLAMVPLSLQASLTDAALYGSNKSPNNARRTYFDLDLEAKLHGLQPEWRKNMGLLSSIKHGKSTPSSVRTCNFGRLFPSPCLRDLCWRHPLYCTRCLTQSKLSSPQQQE